VASIVAVVMVLLAMLGVGLTQASKAAASVYWISLVPLYGILCIWTARIHQQATGTHSAQLIWRQVFHWLGIAVAIGLDFFIGGTNQETALGAGMNALLLLSLGCFLAGVHFEWLFMVVGVLLTVTLVVFVKADQYLWVIVIAGVVSLLAIFFLNRILHPSTW
jgi:hypothetical protein